MEEWMEKMRRWCSIQERSTFDVRRKLHPQGLSESIVNEVVDALISENFLSNERFLESYVRAHVEYKGWGPMRIMQGLRKKGFSGSQAENAVLSVPKARFKDLLAELIEKRSNELPQNRERVIRFLLNRGFHVNEILRMLEEAEAP